MYCGESGLGYICGKRLNEELLCRKSRMNMLRKGFLVFWWKSFKNLARYLLMLPRQYSCLFDVPNSHILLMIWAHSGITVAWKRVDDGGRGCCGQLQAIVFNQVHKWWTTRTLYVLQLWSWPLAILSRIVKKTLHNELSINFSSYFKLIDYIFNKI